MKKYDSIKAYEIAIQIIKADPLYFDIIPVYCASLIDLKYTGELYYCAHNLIENYPNHQLSWYAVGVYYFMIKKYEVSF
jgi:anaphase-promoting complex subunit 6